MNLPKFEVKDKILTPNDIDSTNASTDKLVNLPSFTPYSPSISNEAHNVFANIPGNVNEYIPYFKDGLVPMWHGTQALNEARARNQTGGQLWKGVADQILIGTIVGGTAESIGLLGQLGKQLYNWATLTQDDFTTNSLQVWGQASKEEAQKRSPIYQTQRAQNKFAINDRTWWASNSPSIFSAVSMMIPTRAAAIITMKLGGALVKGLKLKKAFDVTKTLEKSNWLIKAANSKQFKHGADVFVTALYGRHIDSGMEASQLYNTKYEEYKGLNFSDSEAHEYASRAANRAYNVGYTNLLFDVIQWGTILRATKAANIRIDANVAQALGKAEYKNLSLLGEQGAANLAKLATKAQKASGFSIARDIGVEALTQGLEELNVGFARSLGSKHGDILAGIDQDKSWLSNFNKTLGNHLSDKSSWEEFFFGAIGGALFGSVGKIGAIMANKWSDKDVQTHTESLIQNLQAISETTKEMLNLSDKGLHIRADFTQLSLEKNLLDSGLANGNLGVTIELLRNLSSMSESDLKHWGFETVNKDVLSDIANSLEKAADVYNSASDINWGFGKYDTLIAKKLANLKYENSRISSLIERYKKDIKDVNYENLPSYVDQTVIDWTNAKRNKRDTEIAKGIVERNNTKLTSLLEDISKEIIELETSKNNTKSIDETVKLNTKINTLSAKAATINDNINYNELLIKSLERQNKEASTILDTMNDLMADISPEAKAWSDKVMDNTMGDRERGIVDKSNAISTLESRLVATQDAYNSLYSDKELQKKEIDNYKKFEKKLNDTKRSIFKAELAAIENNPNFENWIKSLDELDKKYDGEFSKEIKAKKKELEKTIKNKIDKLEFDKNYNDIVDLLFEGKSESDLSDTQKEFYNSNKEAINKSVSDKKDEANKKAEELKKKQQEADELLKQKNSNLKEELIKSIATGELAKSLIEIYKLSSNLTREKLAVIISDILSEDGTSVLSYDEVLQNKSSEKVSNYSPLIYLLGIYSIQTSLQKDSTLFNHIKSNLNNIVSNALGITVDTSNLNKEELSKSTRLSDKFINNTLYLLIDLDIITNETENSNDNSDLNQEPIVKDLIDFSNNIPNDNEGETSDKKQSRELPSNDLVDENIDAILGSTTLLLKQMMNIFYREYGSDKAVTVGLDDLYDIYIKYGLDNRIIYKSIRFYNLFSNLRKMIGSSYKIIGSNITISLTTNKHQAGTNYISNYIKATRSAQIPNSPNKGMYIYMHFIKNLPKNKNLTPEQEEQLRAYLDLEVGSELEFEYYDDHIDERAENLDIEARNADPNRRPIVIKFNGANVGFVHELPNKHNGILYTDKDGNYKSFVSIMNSKTYELIYNNIDALRSFYKGTTKLDTLPADLLAELSRLALVNTNNSGLVSNEESIRHILDPILIKDPKSGLNIDFIKTAYSVHNMRFNIDHNITKDIRDRISKGEKISITLNRIKDTIEYGEGGYSINERIAPIDPNNPDKKLIVYTDIKDASKQSTNLYDIETGEIVSLNIVNKSELLKTDNDEILGAAYAVHYMGIENGEPFYRISRLNRGTLGYGKAVKQSDGTYKIEYNDDLSISILKAIRAYRNKLVDFKNNKITKSELDALYRELEVNIGQLVELSNPIAKTDESSKRFRDSSSSTYNASLNRFTDNIGIEFSTYSNGIRTRHKLEPAAIKNKDGKVVEWGFKYSTGLPNEKGEISTKDYSIITIQEAATKMRLVRMALPLDKKEGISLSYAEDKEFNNPLLDRVYANYKEFVFSTRVLNTNVTAYLDSQGRPITNRVTSINGKNVGSVFGDLNVNSNPIDNVDNSNIPTDINTTIEGLTGKNINDIDKSQYSDKGLEYLISIANELGISINIADNIDVQNSGNGYVKNGTTTITFGTNINKPLNNTNYKIKQTALINYTLKHEVLHILLNQSEKNMTKEQLDKYHKSIIDYLKSLEDYIADSKNQVRGQDKSVLTEYIKRSREAIQLGNYQEAITYAFADRNVTQLLAMLDIDGKDIDTKSTFWSKLYSIIKDALNTVFEAIAGKNKLSELTEILEGIVSQGIMFNRQDGTDTNDTTEVKGKPDPDPDPNPNKPAFRNWLNRNRNKSGNKKESRELISDLHLGDFYDKNQHIIFERYGIDNKQDFVNIYTSLDEEQKQEIYCI